MVWAPPLDVELDMYDVAVLHRVVLALGSQLSLRPRLVQPAERQEFLPRDDLGPDKAARQVGVDRIGGLERRRPPAQGPGADFVLTDGKERMQPKQIVRCLQDGSRARLGYSVAAQEVRRLLRP